MSPWLKVRLASLSNCPCTAIQITPINDRMKPIICLPRNFSLRNNMDSNIVRVGLNALINVALTGVVCLKPEYSKLA